MTQPQLLALHQPAHQSYLTFTLTYWERFNEEFQYNLETTDAPITELIPPLEFIASPV